MSQQRLESDPRSRAQTRSYQRKRRSKECWKNIKIVLKLSNFPPYQISQYSRIVPINEFCIWRWVFIQERLTFEKIAHIIIAFAHKLECFSNNSLLLLFGLQKLTQKDYQWNLQNTVYSQYSHRNHRTLSASACHGCWRSKSPGSLCKSLQYAIDRFFVGVFTNYWVFSDSITLVLTICWRSEAYSCMDLQLLCQ